MEAGEGACCRERGARAAMSALGLAYYSSEDEAEVAAPTTSEQKLVGESGKEGKKVSSFFGGDFEASSERSRHPNGTRLDAWFPAGWTPLSLGLLPS